LEALWPVWETETHRLRGLAEAEDVLTKALAASRGKATLSKQAELSLKEFRNTAQEMAGPRITSEPSDLEGRLESLLKDVTRAREDLESGLREFEKLGVPRRKPGRKPKVLAECLTAGLGMIYYELSGNEPAVTTDPGDGSARGKFFQLVADAFETFDITAQPEGYARAEARIFKEEIRKAE
jgi:hypothetical protein